MQAMDLSDRQGFVETFHLPLWRWLWRQAESSYDTDLTWVFKALSPIKIWASEIRRRLWQDSPSWASWAYNQTVQAQCQSNSLNMKRVDQWIAPGLRKSQQDPFVGDILEEADLPQQSSWNKTMMLTWAFLWKIESHHRQFLQRWSRKQFGKLEAISCMTKTWGNQLFLSPGFEERLFLWRKVLMLLLDDEDQMPLLLFRPLD